MLVPLLDHGVHPRGSLLRRQPAGARDPPLHVRPVRVLALARRVVLVRYQRQAFRRRRVRLQCLRQRGGTFWGAGVEPVQDPVPDQRLRLSRPRRDRRAHLERGPGCAGHGPCHLVLESRAVERGRDPGRVQLALQRDHPEVPGQLHAGTGRTLLLQRVAVHIDQPWHAQQAAPVQVRAGTARPSAGRHRARRSRPHLGDQAVAHHHASVVDDRVRQHGPHAAEHVVRRHRSGRLAEGPGKAP